MKKKLLTIGVVGILLLTTALVSPFIGAQSIDIINKEPETEPTLETADLENEYYEMVEKLTYSPGQFPGDELKALYQGCSFWDEEEQEWVTVRVQIEDIFGSGLGSLVENFFGPNSLDRGAKENSMKQVGMILNAVEEDEAEIVNNCANAFNVMKDKNGISLEDFPADKRAWAEEQYNLIMEDIEGKDYLQSLINKITKSDYMEIPELNITVLIYCLLYLIALAGLMALPFGTALVGMAEGALLGVAFGILMSEANVSAQLGAQLKAMLGGLVPGMDWELVATILLGTVAAFVYFTLFSCFRVVRILGGAGAAIGGCVAIYMYFTLMVNISKWGGRSRSSPAPTTMPMIKVFFARIFERFPQLRRLGIFS